MSVLFQVVAPSAEPISFADFCYHSRITSATGDEDYFNTLEQAVRVDAERYCNKCFITQTWKLYLDEWPDYDYIEIPYAPMSACSAIKYTDYLGSETTWASGNYYVDTLATPGRIVLGYNISYPSDDLYVANAIEITFTAGYSDAPSGVPAGIRAALLIQVADLWENRESILIGKPFVRLPTATLLLNQYRDIRF